MKRTLKLNEIDKMFERAEYSDLFDRVRKKMAKKETLIDQYVLRKGRDWSSLSDKTL